MNIKKAAFYFLILWIALSKSVIAQQQVVTGRVLEKGSGESLPYVHVFLKGTGIGTTSDTAGYFSLKFNKADVSEDSLIISYIGYTTTKVTLSSIDKDLTIYMTPELFSLDEFVIRPGENMAWPILRHAIGNKNTNDAKFQKSYTCEEYSRIRFDLNHFTEKIKKNLLLKPFDYIWKNVDTTPEGVTYLPVLMVEKLIRHHYQGDPVRLTDEVLATNTTGLAGPKLMAFVQDLYQAPDFYDNYVVILDKNFPSPLNENYKNNYKFYLTDSMLSSHGKLYKITFKPRQKHDLAFTGDMTIDSTTGGLKEINVRFDILANINFIRSFFIHQSYELMNGKDWMLTASNVIGDFTVIENSSDLTGFFGRKDATFRNYEIGKPVSDTILRLHEKEVETEGAENRTGEYWKESRHFELTKQDQEVFQMSNRLEKDPAFIFRKNVVLAIATGYYPVKGIDIGNIFTFYSRNNVENSRFKLGFKTDEKWNVPVSFAAYAAYGMKDEKWKYSLKGEYHLGKGKYPRQHFGASYFNDIIQLGRSFDALPLDDVFSTLLQVGKADASRNYLQDLNVYCDKTWITGFVSRVNFFNSVFSPTPGFQYNYIRDNGVQDQMKNYTAAGVDVTLKFSQHNKSLRGSFYDASSGKRSFKRYPELALQVKVADKQALGSQFDFQKLRLSVKQEIRAKKLGYFKYFIEAGKTFGTVPYTFLDIPYGNQLVLNDDYAFNLMKFMEYASDQYVTISLAQHLEGLGLDRIPYVNKLKWRSFVFAKAYFSSLSAANAQSPYLFPKQLKGANDPYCEVGFGFENIFKIARIDLIWRLTDMNQPDVYYFLVKPSFNFSL